MQSFTQRIGLVLVTALALSLATPLASAEQAQELLLNPNFTTSCLTTLKQRGVTGPSAAAQWLVWNNSLNPVTVTQLLPSTRQGRSPEMLYVNTNGAYNGLYQFFTFQKPYPTRTLLRVGLYVVRGKVMVATAADGAINCRAYSATTGQWELIECRNTEAPANEIVIYAISAGAEFYVVDASVTVLPEEEVTASKTGKKKGKE
jgi:hypothetical protein